MKVITVLWVREYPYSEEIHTDIFKGKETIRYITYCKIAQEKNVYMCVYVYICRWIDKQINKTN